METLKQSTMSKLLKKLCHIHKYENSTTYLFNTFFLDEIAEITVEKYEPFSVKNSRIEIATKSKMNSSIFSVIFTSESHKIELRIFNPRAVGIHQDFLHRNIHHDDV